MNIFKLDKPNSRKDFIFTWLYISAYTLIIGIVTALIIYTIGLTDVTRPIFLVLAILFTIISVYISWLNYAKRLWDITNNKADAIFYAIAIWVANIAMNFIPYLSIVGTIFSIVVLILLFFKKGKPQTEQVVETNNEQENNQ